MPKKGPKCVACGKTLQIMSYGAAYVKVVKPKQARATFLCLKCAEDTFGEALEQLGGEEEEAE